MKRSKHNLSHYRLLTAKMGQLLPVGCVEVLPGDTFQHGISALIRMTPLLAPVMHPVQVRVHHFYVPTRLIWDQWEDFITGKDPALTIPQTASPNLAGGTGKDDILHLLGVPLAPDGTATCNALPMYAFNTIVNEYFLDQDLDAQRSITARSIPYVRWEKDYFTAARPWAQKGDEITLPFAQTAPVVSTGSGIPSFYQGSSNVGNLTVLDGSTRDVHTGTAPAAGDNGVGMRWSVTNLQADLSAATATSINDLRKAFALQRYQEARAQYGSRFTEYLRYLGITPSDARLQRPEYLGGGTTRLNFSEVLQTTPATEVDTDGVGDMYGHGIAGVKGNAYRKFFEEHGFVISLLSVRPKAIYQNGIGRMWLKKTKEDYFQKELAHIGQQPILKSEVYHAAGNDAVIFGYGDRYQEYKQEPSLVQREFRVGEVLDYWHMARDLPSDVALNSTFIACNPTTRVYQVATNDNMWIQVKHKLVARRMVPSSNKAFIK